MWAWLAAFAFTQFVECPLYVLAQRRAERAAAWKVLVAFGASAITHPVVWFVIPELWMSAGWLGGYWGMAAVAEASAIAVEAVYLRRCSVGRPWLWALAANLSSVSLGLASRSVFGWP